MGKVTGRQATSSHTNALSISKILKTATKFNILVLKTSNLVVLLIFACSFNFWYSQSAGITVHLRVSRSRDPYLQKAYC